MAELISKSWVLGLAVIIAACGSTSFSGGNGHVTTPPPQPVVNSGPLQPVASPQPTAVPANATTVGSFTVWTDPAHPAAYEDYNIVVRVSLPSTISTLTQSDLSGSVHGTDTYVQNFGPSDPSSVSNFTMQSGFAQESIWVPGGAQSVRDTIVVSSAALNETQTIAIVFGS